MRIRNLLDVKVGTLAKIFSKLEDGINISNLSMDIRMTICNIFEVIGLLEEKGIVKTERVGREKKVYLTEKGRKLMNLPEIFLGE